MNRWLVWQFPMLFLLLGLSGVQVRGVEFVFDLSKGPVSFTYTTTGAYNPIEITVVGKNGEVHTFLLSDYYRGRTYVTTTGDLLFSQLAAVPWLGLTIEGLRGTLSFTAATPDGSHIAMTMTGNPGSVSVRLETEGVGQDTSDKTIQAVVQADLESGKMTIQDGSPAPDPELLLSQQYGIPPQEAEKLIDQFGLPRVTGALETVARYNGWAHNAVAGGAATFNGPSVSLNDLPPGEVFRISLWGLKYQGFLRDSTLYMRLLHPGNGISLKDVRIILTVVELDGSGPPDIVLWDRFPYDELDQCYRYKFYPQPWRPGPYEVYIDIGRILNFKLPVRVTEKGQLVPRED